MTTTTPQQPSVPDSTKNSTFCSAVAPQSLRITCYGSSSSKTPEKYLREARVLGYILARRGHVCVNGAGSFGCMAAMNDGVLEGNGHVVGVIHEMFLVDNGYWGGGGGGVDGRDEGVVVIRDGGAHRVFQHALTRSKHETVAQDHPVAEAPIREILVAGGDDLQERKKLLVQKCDGLVVLPGGPGTWDEVRYGRYNGNEYAVVVQLCSHSHGFHVNTALGNGMCPAFEPQSASDCLRQCGRIL
jgi:predicted Rossmann-fold nucleotide-binding protein